MSHVKLISFEGQPAVSLVAPGGAAATVLLQGGHVVSWVPGQGEEQLYLSPRSRFGAPHAVRGGVPVIFPQFAARGTGPRHGFARTRAWTLAESVVRGPFAQAVLLLTDDEATRALWPHPFQLELTVAIGAKQMDLELAITNTGDTPFDAHAALHTYLRTNDVLKAQVEGLQGVAFEDHTKGGEAGRQWGDVVQVVGEIDRLYHEVPGALTLRELGRRVEIEHRGFDDAVVWNPGPAKAAALDDLPPEDWQRFICIEAAQVVAPVQLAPGDEWAAMQTLIAG